MSFIGNVPAEAYSPVAKDTFSGNSSTTDFTLSIPATTNSVNVYVENVAQEPTTAYTISGTTLSFTAAPVTGTNNIYVIHRGPAVQQIVPPAGVALNPSTVDATGDISTEGDLKVETTSGGIYTITGTDTATNRTLTLPDEAGTVLTSVSSIPSSQITNGGLVHIKTQTASNASSVDFVNGSNGVVFDNTYNNYVLFGRDLYAASGASLRIEITTDTGATYKTSSYSTIQFRAIYENASAGSGANRITGAIFESFYNLSTDSTKHTSMEVHFWSPSTTKYPMVSGRFDGMDTANITAQLISGYYDSSTSYDGFRIKMGSGNIYGTFSLYGVKES